MLSCPSPVGFWCVHGAFDLTICACFGKKAFGTLLCCVGVLKGSYCYSWCLVLVHVGARKSVLVGPGYGWQTYNGGYHYHCDC